MSKSLAISTNRRVFLGSGARGLGGAALATLLGSRNGLAHAKQVGTHFEPKAKRVIYLFQSGGPAQQDLFDHKPALNELHGQELP
ncbi:MAG: DUF1501 domain-containing protein, partial [Planctomycetota bacterium]